MLPKVTSKTPFVSVEATSKTRRSPRPYLTVGLEAIYHHIPLGLVFPEIPEESLLFGVVFSYPLQAALYEALDVILVESQGEMSLSLLASGLSG
jgi:hypothetical protein